MEPLFKKTNVSKLNLDGVMREYCDKHKLLSSPQSMIISSFFAENYVAYTDLYKYYIKCGFEVTDVSVFIEYEEAEIFKDFADKIVSMRRDASTNDEKKPIAGCMKLSGIFLT